MQPIIYVGWEKGKEWDENEQGSWVHTQCTINSTKKGKRFSLNEKSRYVKKTLLGFAVNNGDLNSPKMAFSFFLVSFHIC